MPIRLDAPAAIADLVRAKDGLGLRGGILVANPIPAQDEIPFTEMRNLIERAVEEARRNNIVGKAVTPFLLSYLNRITDGRSLAANIALVKQNAALAARIAVALAQSP